MPPTAHYPAPPLPSRLGRRSDARPRLELTLRVVGTAGLLAMAAVHLQELIGDHYSQIPTIGTLFWLNAASGIVLAVLVLARPNRLFVLSGMAVALGALAGLFISENGGLFGFEEYGYRLAIMLAIAAEAVAAAALGSLLVLQSRRR